MHVRSWVSRAAVAAVCLSMAAPLVAQSTTEAPYQPSVGQPGKDVVWVPTSDVLVQKMLDMASVKAGDYVIDLGSGDGRTVIAAAKRGATAMGIEYNPDMVELSKRNAQAAGVNVTFVKADLFETDLSKASVITMFLLPSINLQLRPKLLDLAPGTRIVSNSFSMEDWEPDQEATVSGECTSWCTALFWVVPAKVEGTWQMPAGVLTLRQEFQNVYGTLGTTEIMNGRLRGDTLTFTAGGTSYSAKVSGSTMTGAGGRGGTWTARRDR